MPYYCTVPRCTSMAGKVKNVSFHQFPRDEELAKLWNDILKRGKPYTKYSKVCSLHFKQEDYTITSAGKNKGQWRTLRKDAIPSQNLPSDTPAPYTRRQTGSWAPSSVPAIDPQLHQQAQQLAQAIYVQTMLAMQAVSVQDAMANGFSNGPPPFPQPYQSNSTISPTEREPDLQPTQAPNPLRTDFEHTSYKCNDCSKWFKDPDVFLLHKRTHKDAQSTNGKENLDLNSIKPEMLKANPILANLLKNSVDKDIFAANILEKQLLVSFSNMEDYFKSVANKYNCDSSSLDNSNLVIDENIA
ncbi:unnamed protein product [Spodoptera littoralis]|uniref:THAP-type domain-containing protein n=1 Tax=Spodoptera littoralis TaxID=7109 RepID=A0A9P0I9U6_SPOLI|nr:unnamed protein product [Spodoptera littoralis]CAH1642358.1 unnamed protein product [Spodoptera littoralis]